MSSEQKNQYRDNNTKNRTHTNANSLTSALAESYSEYSKIERDYYPFFWRHTRPSAAGFFMPVDYAQRGFMPSSRGIQDGENRNKRVVFQKDDSRTRLFLRPTKTISGVTAMCNQTTGVVRLPFLISGDSAKRITFQEAKNSKVASIDGYLVGTICPGNCTSTRNNETFYDVAFPRVTFAADGKRATGIMLDQVTFSTEHAAIHFIKQLVTGEVVEVQQ